MVNIVKSAQSLSGQIKKFISSDTFKKLAEATKAIAGLYPTINDMVEAVKKLEMDPVAKIPNFKDPVSGSKHEMRMRMPLPLSRSQHGISGC